MIFGLCILTCTHCKFLGPQWIFEFCNYYRTQNVDQLFVLCILLHPLNTRTWKVPAAIECLNLCTRIHALIECVCISTHQQRRTPICILQGTCFLSHCYCLCFLVKYLCLNVYILCPTIIEQSNEELLFECCKSPAPSPLHVRGF